MIAASERSGCKLMVSHNQRRYEPHIRAKELIRQGEIGRVISFRTFLGIKGPEYSSVLESTTAISAGPCPAAASCQTSARTELT